MPVALSISSPIKLALATEHPKSALVPVLRAQLWYDHCRLSLAAQLRKRAGVGLIGSKYHGCLASGAPLPNKMTEAHCPASRKPVTSYSAYSGEAARPRPQGPIRPRLPTVLLRRGAKDVWTARRHFYFLATWLPLPFHPTSPKHRSATSARSTCPRRSHLAQAVASLQRQDPQRSISSRHQALSCLVKRQSFRVRGEEKHSERNGLASLSELAWLVSPPAQRRLLPNDKRHHHLLVVISPAITTRAGWRLNCHSALIRLELKLLVCYTRLATHCVGNAVVGSPPGLLVAQRPANSQAPLQPFDQPQPQPPIRHRKHPQPSAVPALGPRRTTVHDTQPLCSAASHPPIAGRVAPPCNSTTSKPSLECGTAPRLPRAH